VKRYGLVAAAILVLTSATGTVVAGGAYKNFRAAIYVTVDGTHRLEDPKVREQQYRRIAGQLRFDKVSWRPIAAVDSRTMRRSTR